MENHTWFNSIKRKHHDAFLYGAHDF